VYEKQKSIVITTTKLLRRYIELIYSGPVHHHRVNWLVFVILYLFQESKECLIALSQLRRYVEINTNFSISVSLTADGTYTFHAHNVIALKYSLVCVCDEQDNLRYS